MKNLFQSSNPVIGVSIPVIWSGQYIQSLKGIRDASEKYNINLICFQGIYFSSSYDSGGIAHIEKSGTVIYDLLKDIRLDAMILHTGSLHTMQHKNILKNLCKSGFQVPMINIGSKIDGMINLLVDNKHGMTELLNHLILDHGYRRFGFVRGPEDNFDAQDRLLAFQKAMSDNGISVDKSNITAPGGWSFESGRKSARQLLDNSESSPDVIICASDLLAKGVIHELKLQEISVPDQISVVGFNDSSYAEICNPPLTTVSLKLYERSWKAIEIFNDYFNGKALPERDIRTASSLKIRHSCGCQSSGLQAIDQIAEINSTADKFHSVTESLSLKQFKTRVHKELRLLKFPQPAAIVNVFLDSFISQLKSLSGNNFIHSFGRILHTTFVSKDDYKLWHLALSILEENLPSVLDKDDQQTAKKCILQARVLISEVAAAQYTKALFMFAEQTSAINSLNCGLLQNGIMNNILKIIGNKLPSIGLTSCFISLYENPENPIETSKLIYAYCKHSSYEIPPDGISFKSASLLPDEISVNNNFIIIEPLFVNTNQIGFTIFELSSLENTFNSLFPSQLSSSLWAAIMFTKKEQADNKGKQQSEELEFINSKLTERAGNLNSAVKQLQSNQDRLRTYEKMASLGKFTAGITHEISTPLATLRACLIDMKKLANEYNNSIDDPSVTAPDHREIVKEFSQSAQLARNAAARAIDFIKSIKAQSRDIRGTEIQVFYLTDILNTVTLFLSHQLKHSNCKVISTIDMSLSPILGSPTKMTQVFTNLISNSIDAMESNNGGTVNFEMSNDTIDTTIIKVADTGCGIPENLLSSIFSPMFTTKPYGKGTGLGLSIVYDIITNDFGGTISVDSKVSSGTTFTIRIINNLREYKEYMKNGTKI